MENDKFLATKLIPANPQTFENGLIDIQYFEIQILGKNILLLYIPHQRIG